MIRYCLVVGYCGNENREMDVCCDILGLVSSGCTVMKLSIYGNINCHFKLFDI